jgi:hypothetical protein
MGRTEELASCGCSLDSLWVVAAGLGRTVYVGVITYKGKLRAQITSRMVVEEEMVATADRFVQILDAVAKQMKHHNKEEEKTVIEL